jgi:hypothetical protein
MVWQKNDEEDPRIKDPTDWIDLDNYKEVEHRAGVYIFADDNKDVKYIGMAGARRLVLEHLTTFEIYSAISRGKNDGATLVKALYTNSREISKIIERELVGKYNPPNNVYLVTED